MDVDGDGLSEVVVLQGHGNHGFMWNYLEIWGLRKGSMARLASFTVFVSNGGLADGHVEDGACVVSYRGGPLDRRSSYQIQHFERRGESPRRNGPARGAELTWSGIPTSDRLETGWNAGFLDAKLTMKSR